MTSSRPRSTRYHSRAATEPPGVTLAPVYESMGVVPAGYDFTATQVHKHEEPHSNGSADAAFPLVSLAELADEDLVPPARDLSFAGVPRGIALSGARFTTHAGNLGGSHPSDLAEPLPGAPAKTAIPALAWIIPAGILCLAFLILGIGVAQFMGPNDGGEADGGGLLAGISPDRDAAFGARAIAPTDRGTDERERRERAALQSAGRGPGRRPMD